MIEITQAIVGRTAVIQVLEKPEELEPLKEWLVSKEGVPLAVDTETTGLDIFSEEFRVRTIQIGAGLEAWVIPTEVVPTDADLLESLLGGRKLIFHNASYDILAIKQAYDYTIDWNNVTDTKILASLHDPRSSREGGTGQSLIDLTRAFISDEIATDVKGSMSLMSKETGLKKAELFATIPWNNETYLRYAGMDVVLTYGLHNILLNELEKLNRAIPEFNLGLIEYEHRVAAACNQMEQSGFLVDTDYCQRLASSLQEEQDVWEWFALDQFGVDSVNSTAQVADAIFENGYRLTELTPSGNWRVDKAVLDELSEKGFLLADYVIAAKAAKKKRASWVEKFLEGQDPQGRIHANINTLAARTARMSVTGIPAQTLPSSGWEIRRCFVASEGNSIVACDYQAQELRVLAALSGDKNMREAFANDADLHQMTADASGVERSVGKTVNFAYVYGSGAGNIASTCGISVKKAKEVITGFEKTYPGVHSLSVRLQEEAKAKGYIVTPVGRYLPVDPDRPYAALNYMIQSTSRDITASAILRLVDKGFGPYLRLPVHDEIIAEVPEEKADWAAKEISEIMACDFRGVHIGSDHEVYGRSWGGGYVDQDDPEDQKMYDASFN